MSNFLNLFGPEEHSAETPAGTPTIAPAVNPLPIRKAGRLAYGWDFDELEGHCVIWEGLGESEWIATCVNGEVAELFSAMPEMRFAVIVLMDAIAYDYHGRKAAEDSTATVREIEAKYPFLTSQPRTFDARVDTLKTYASKRGQMALAKARGESTPTTTTTTTETSEVPQ